MLVVLVLVAFSICRSICIVPELNRYENPCHDVVVLFESHYSSSHSRPHYMQCACCAHCAHCRSDHHERLINRLTDRLLSLEAREYGPFAPASDPRRTHIHKTCKHHPRRTFPRTAAPCGHGCNSDTTEPFSDTTERFEGFAAHAARHCSGASQCSTPNELILLSLATEDLPIDLLHAKRARQSKIAEYFKRSPSCSTN